MIILICCYCYKSENHETSINVYTAVKLHVTSSAVLKCEYREREIGNVNAKASNS